MHHYLFLFLFFIASTISAQNSGNYIRYHQQCRAAEKAFIDSAYEECMKLYQTTFNEYDFLFPRDCYIAAQLAFKKGYDSLAVQFLKKGVPFGLNAELIFDADTNLYLREIRGSKHWPDYVRDYPQLRKKYTERVDWDLKYKLLRMLAHDQKMRKRNNKWFNRNFRKGLEKKFDIINRQHVAFLDSVFKLRGYPGIWLTGVGDGDSMAYNNNRNCSDVVALILYHNDSVAVKYDAFLKSEIANGHIYPRTYAIIHDFRDRFLVKKDKDQKMYYNIWWEAKNFSEEEYMAHCHEIGCPTKKHLIALSKAAGKKVDVFLVPFR